MGDVQCVTLPVFLPSDAASRPADCTQGAGRSKQSSCNTVEFETNYSVLQGCRGFAPSYSASQQEELQRVLSAVRAVFEEAYDPVIDRTSGG